MKGTIKWISYDKGYGFVFCSERTNDLFFHLSEYKSHEVLIAGDTVSFELGLGRNGKDAAKDVRFVDRTIRQAKDRAFYGKPTKKKGEFVPRNTSSTLGGIAVGLLFGPVGGLIGGLLGSGGFERAPGTLITSACLRCGGTGHVTNLDERFIGFQCERCKAFWKKRNVDRIKKSDLED